jgi:hypothetical protein
MAMAVGHNFGGGTGREPCGSVRTKFSKYDDHRAGQRPDGRTNG